jgi:3-oxoacyl-[acyl-carrier protein] reductase
MDLGLRNKRALVTAASRGLGLASARALAAEGARVAMAGTEATRIALDAVSALAVHIGNIAFGDRLGRVHVFEAEEFLRQKGNAS